MRTAMMFPLGLACVLAGATEARADQCAWLDADTAARAVKELAVASSVIDYCEPCGDAAPGRPRDAGELTVRSPERGYWEVARDGRGIDLAYTYVHSEERGPGYFNVARLVECPAEGVSPSLRVGVATPSGVLITADTTEPPEPPPAVAQMPVTSMAAAPAPAPATIAPAPIVIYVSEPGAPYRLLLALSAIALAVGAQALLLLALMRRRSASLPRAIALTDIPRNPID